MAEITVEHLATSNLNGDGAFEKLMAAINVHIHSEFTKSRIKGTDYATVYLGSIQAAMSHALQLLLSRQKADQEARLLEQQILNAQKEYEILQAQKEKLETEKAVLVQQQAKDVAETELIEQRILTEKAQISPDGVDIDSLVGRQKALLEGQKCKLDAEFDLLAQQRLKAVSETALLEQKKVTESAQISGVGVDPDSVIGQQKALYQAQRDGFKRDAEQKATRLLIESWQVRRTTDTGTVADGVNKLDDNTIGSAVTKLLEGIDV